MSKPVVTFVCGNACSAGYLVASATNYVITNSCCYVGSIGVFSYYGRYNNKKLREDGIIADVTTVFFKGGAFKGLEDPNSEKLSKEEKKYLQKRIDDTYKVFVKQIAQNRSLDIKKASRWADGKLFLPYQALKLGLIDEIGTIFEAKQKLIELISLKHPDTSFEEEVELVFIGEPGKVVEK